MMGVFAAQHGQIVEMIAGGHSCLGADAEDAAQFGQGGALAVAPVTQAYVDVVAHRDEVGMPLAKCVQLGVDLVHLQVGLSDGAQG